ncbi:MAG: Crp/Fnr family transcriptional regulator [Terriglobales bacterium]
MSCKFREDRLFCDLSPTALQRLASIKSTAMYPKGALLFIEGQLPRGVFILCQGKAKLSTSSRDGKTIILKIADAGEVLGLSATISGRPYEVSVEMMEPAQANFIARDQFLAFLKEHGDAALRVAEQLSENYHTAYEEIRTLGLTTSASEKLAKLILEWSAGAGNAKSPLKMRLLFTHEEIAEMIGTSRETVSRLFSDFKKKRLLEVKGSILTIRNKAGLEHIVQS